MKMISIKKSLLFVSITIVILLILQEILFRFIFPIPEISNFNRIHYSPLFFGSDREEVQFLSNSSFIWRSDPDNAGYVNELNLYGFRDKDWETDKKKDIIRVAFVGDSFCEGFMTTADSSIPAQFGKIAYQDYRDIESMNFGIGGSNFSAYFRVIRDITQIFKPEYIFLIINSNDFPIFDYKNELLEDKITPNFNSLYVPRIVEILSNYFENKPVPKIWHSKPFYFFSSVPSLRNPWSLAKNTSLWKEYVSPKIMKAMSTGHFNPFSVDEYDKYKKNLVDSINVAEYFVKLRNFSDQNNIKVFIVYVPSRSQVTDKYLKYQSEFSRTKKPSSLTGYEYQLHARLLKSTSRTLGLSFLDFTPVFSEAEKNGRKLYWDYDEHLNSKGYGLAAETMYKFWKNKIE